MLLWACCLSLCFPQAQERQGASAPAASSANASTGADTTWASPRSNTKHTFFHLHTPGWTFWQTFLPSIETKLRENSYKRVLTCQKNPSCSKEKADPSVSQSSWGAGQLLTPTRTAPVPTAGWGPEKGWGSLGLSLQGTEFMGLGVVQAAGPCTASGSQRCLSQQLVCVTALCLSASIYHHHVWNPLTSKIF